MKSAAEKLDPECFVDLSSKARREILMGLLAFCPGKRLLAAEY